MDAAVAALLGTALGAVGALGSAWIQQRHQTRRERLKTAADLGLADFNHQIKQLPEGSAGLPLSVFVAYHLDVLDALANESFDADAIAKIDQRQIALTLAIARRPTGKEIRESNERAR